MGLLSFLAKPAPLPMRLPSGSFTMDRSGRVLVSTLPSQFPAELLEQIGQAVLQTFRDAQAVQLPLAELNVHYGSLKISARELRGGSLVFLSPITPITPQTTA